MGYLRIGVLIGHALLSFGANSQRLSNGIYLSYMSYPVIIETIPVKHNCSDSVVTQVLISDEEYEFHPESTIELDTVFELAGILKVKGNRGVYKIRDHVYNESFSIHNQKFRSKITYEDDLILLKKIGLYGKIISNPPETDFKHIGDHNFRHFVRLEDTSSDISQMLMQFVSSKMIFLHNQQEIIIDYVSSGSSQESIDFALSKNVSGWKKTTSGNHSILDLGDHILFTINNQKTYADGIYQVKSITDDLLEVSIYKYQLKHDEPFQEQVIVTKNVIPLDRTDQLTKNLDGTWHYSSMKEIQGKLFITDFEAMVKFTKKIKYPNHYYSLTSGIINGQVEKWEGISFWELSSSGEYIIFDNGYLPFELKDNKLYLFEMYREWNDERGAVDCAKVVTEYVREK